MVRDARELFERLNMNIDPTAYCRDLPVAPKETFRQWWKRTHKDSDANAPRTDAPATGIPLASEHGMTTNTTPKEA